MSPSASPATGRRIQTRRSGVHGKGVFAVAPIAEGDTIIEYVGEVIGWDEAQDRHPHDPADPNHTFYFHVDADRVIDANFGGNSSRWINHSCDPNCIADEVDGRIFIKALRNIAPGEELNYDYGLVIDEPYTPALLADFPCWCGSESCRGTLLSPNDDGDVPGKDKHKHKKAKKAKKARDGKADQGKDGAKKPDNAQEAKGRDSQKKKLKNKLKSKPKKKSKKSAAASEA